MVIDNEMKQFIDFKLIQSGFESEVLTLKNITKSTMIESNKSSASLSSNLFYNKIQKATNLLSKSRNVEDCYSKFFLQEGK